MLMRDFSCQIKMGSSPVTQLSIEDWSNAKGQVSWYKLLTNPYFIWTKFRIKKGQGRSYFCQFFVNQPQLSHFIFFKINSKLDSKPFWVKVSYLNWIDLFCCTPIISDAIKNFDFDNQVPSAIQQCTSFLSTLRQFDISRVQTNQTFFMLSLEPEQGRRKV